jgi:hypothetical protein
MLSQAAAALVVALAAACAPAQVSPPAEKATTQAAPPVFPKRFHRTPNGQLYVPATPVRMTIALPGGAPDGGSANIEVSSESSVNLKEGPTTLEFGGARVPVIVDGTPPKTVLDVGETTHVDHLGVRVLPPATKLKISATDALSGVAQTLISLDGTPFAPPPPGGPVVTAEGEHRLRYFSVDQVGNTEKMQEYVFRVDGTPPQTHLQVANPKAANVVGIGSSLTLSAEDPYAGVESILYRLDDAAEQGYEKPILLDMIAEGPHKLLYHSVDRVGNKEPAQTFPFIVDRQPPNITLTLQGPVHAETGVRYVSPKTEVQLVAQDAVAGATPVRYRIDGAAADTVYSAPFHLPQVSGIHRLHLESVDTVKNLAQTLVTDLYLDPTPPTTEIEYSHPFFERDGDIVLTSASKIALNASDFESGVDTVTYSLDGGAEQKYTTPFSVAAIGKHKLAFYSIDHVGNRETTKQVSLSIEKAAIASALPNTLDAKRWYLHPKLGLMGPEGLAFDLRISDSPNAGAESYMLTTGPKSTGPSGPLMFTAPGATKLKIAISPKPSTFGVGIDALPPKTDLAITGAHRFDAGGVTYFGPGLKLALASVDDSTGLSSGVWKTLFSMGDSAFAAYSAPFDKLTREGAYSLRYYALDNVGNAESPHTFDFTVDTSPPRTRLELQGPHLADTVAPTTHVTLTTTDNLSGVAEVEYQIDEGKPLNYTQPWVIGSMTEGVHHMRYFAVDGVGNREDLHNWTFTVKKTVNPASMEVIGHSVERGGATYVAPGTQIVLKVSEGDTAIYDIDGGTPVHYTVPIVVPGLGSHRISFHAEDIVQNVSATRTLNLVVDRTPPESRVHFDGPQLSRESGILISGNTRIVLQANAGAVGSATLQYSLNGGRWQPYSAPITVKTSGNFDLAYRSSNPLMSQEGVQRQHFVVDAQGPVITTTYSAPVDAAGDSVLMPPGTLVFVDAEDSPAGMQKITCKVDSRPEVIYRTPLSGFAPGSAHTITIVAEDLLGNRSEKVVHLKVKETSK